MENINTKTDTLQQETITNNNNIDSNTNNNNNLINNVYIVYKIHDRNNFNSNSTPIKGFTDYNNAVNYTEKLNTIANKKNKQTTSILLSIPEHIINNPQLSQFYLDELTNEPTRFDCYTDELTFSQDDMILVKQFLIASNTPFPIYCIHYDTIQIDTSTSTTQNETNSI